MGVFAGRALRLAEMGGAAVVAAAVTMAMTPGRQPVRAADMARVADVVRAESAAAQAGTAGDATYFLTVDGITDVSTNPAHRNEIALLSWSFEATTPRDPSTGLETGRPQYGPLKVAADTSSATPQLLADLATNKNLRTVRLVEFRPGTGRAATTPLLTLELTDVNVSKFSAGGADGSASDTYEFTYQHAKMTVGNNSATVPANPG
jgi:type VI secretion system Hcp family effector